jgi:uncharacterized protein YutD
MWIRIKKDCNLTDRLRKLEDFAQELNLSIKFGCGIFLVDELTDKEYHFLDLEAHVENLEQADSYIYEFPSKFEYKLCRETDED